MIDCIKFGKSINKVSLLVLNPSLREKGVPVISLSDQKDIALEVTVRNKNGDDAHEAKLVGHFDESLSYSGFRSPKNSVSGSQI